MKIKEECETCHWNIQKTSKGDIKCHKDKNWRIRKRN